MKRRILLLPILLALLQLCYQPAGAQKQFMRTFSVSVSEETVPIPSNSISQLASRGAELWMGTSKGLTRTTNFGHSWVNYGNDPAFANDGIFALDILGDTVWAATGFEKDATGGGSVQTGSGYAFSVDAGATWQHVGQTLDARGDSIISYGINDSLWFLPVIVPEQNVTFDLSLSSGTVWIASWASGLRKSTDRGATWNRILLPPDSRSSIKPSDTLWTYAPADTLQQRRLFQRFDPRSNNNMLAFAVQAYDADTIWCGTAGGVNKSTDGGESWVRFTHQNQQQPILGNWVIAIDIQPIMGGQRVWTTNWKADDQTEDYGVSYTDNGGRTWTNRLQGVKAYDFAFNNAVAYVASDDGLFRTTDGGETFTVFTYFSDPAARQVIDGARVFTVHVIGDTVYAGTSEGLVSTVDNGATPFGSSWNISRTYQAVGTSAVTYAYPNPFAPPRDITRIHYGTSARTSQRRVSIDIFDFGMNRVRTLIHDAQRDPDREYDEIWDGRTDDGTMSANGVYIYRVQVDDDEPLYGKILVLQ